MLQLFKLFFCNLDSVDLSNGEMGYEVDAIKLLHSNGSPMVDAFILLELDNLRSLIWT